jgi:hypothetical protein
MESLMKKVTSAIVAAKAESASTTAVATPFPGVTKAASLAGRALARLEAEGQRIHAELNGESDRGFSAVSSKEGFTAVIKHGRTVIEIQGDDFAVRQTD